MHNRSAFTNNLKLLDWLIFFRVRNYLFYQNSLNLSYKLTKSEILRINTRTWKEWMSRTLHFDWRHFLQFCTGSMKKLLTSLSVCQNFLTAPRRSHVRKYKVHWYLHGYEMAICFFLIWKPGLSISFSFLSCSFSRVSHRNQRNFCGSSCTIPMIELQGGQELCLISTCKSCTVLRRKVICYLISFIEEISHHDFWL